MNPYSISPLLCAAFAAALGIFVFLKNTNSPVNRVFGLLCLETFWWQFFWFISYYFTTDLQRMLTIKIAWTLILFLPFTHYHFTIRYLRLVKEMTWVRSLYFIGLLWLILLWGGDLFIAYGYNEFKWGYYTKAGPLHPIYLVFVIFVLGRTLFLLKRATTDPIYSAISRNQNKFVFWAIALYFIAAAEYITNYGVDFYPIGGFSILISFSVIGYAIVKYNLMGIEVAFKETLAKTISFLCIGGVAYLLIYLCLELFALRYPALFVLIAMAIMAFSFPLIKRTSKLISQTIRPRQDLEATFKRYTESEIIGSHNVKELANLIVKTVSDSLKPKVCSLMLLDKQNNLYNVVASSVKDEEIKSIAFKESNHLISTLRNSNVKLIVKDELSKILSEEDAKLVRRDLDILNAQLCLPLRLKEELVGLLSLGAKASGELYTPEEMGFIFVFTTQSAMMLRFLEEIGEFERKLIYAEKLAGMTNLLDGFNHEIRNQMGTVQFYIANAHRPELKEDMKNYRNLTLDAFESIMMILDSVQGYRETSELKQLSLTDIKEEINSAIAQLKPKFEKIKAKINTYIPNNLPQLETYPSFKYLFSNILHNSYYALAQRKTRLLDIKVSQTQDSRSPIEIVISDTGGDLLKVMDKQELSSGGEYFPERATVGGINYFLAKHIVDDHQGILKISTNTATEERGTIFTIRLPLKQPKS
jgi:signal transduction histidine kinase